MLFAVVVVVVVVVDGVVAVDVDVDNVALGVEVLFLRVVFFSCCSCSW